MTKVYKSKTGPGIIILLSIILGTISRLLIRDKAWAGLLIILALVLFIIYLVKTTYYTIFDGKLNVRSAFFVNTTIAISSITKISETNIFLSAPAPSLDRLEIVYNEFSSLIISPKDKKGFIDAIVKQNPAVVVSYRNGKTGKPLWDHF